MADRVFGSIIPILTDEEYDNKEHEVWKKREADDVIARLQVMYHVATHMTDDSGMMVLAVEAFCLGEPDKIKQYIDFDVANRALEEIMATAKASLAGVEEEKTAAFRADPHLTADGREPNAVLVKTDGSAELVHLDGFVDSNDLGKPLDCDSTDIVLKNLPAWGEDLFGIDLAGCVDKNGIPKGLEENERMEMLSGYDMIAGDCVLVGVDDRYNYLPLNPQDAVAIWEYFNE